MEKTLEFYMGLDYTVEMRELPVQYGGGCVATIPLLASASATGWGDTPAKALASLEKNKSELFKQLLEEGVEIPEPSDEGFGGEILVNLPGALHRKIAEIAGSEGVELDACIVGLLSNAVMLPR